MAIKNIQIRPKGDGSYSDVLHPETNAGQVKFADGTTVEAHKADVEDILEDYQSHKAKDVQIAHPPHKHDVYVPLVGMDEFVENGETIYADAPSITVPSIPTTWTTVYTSEQINVPYIKRIYISISASSGGGQSEYNARLRINGNIVKTVSGNSPSNLLRELGGIYSIDDMPFTIMIEIKKISGTTFNVTLNSVTIKGNIVLEGIM